MPGENAHGQPLEPPVGLGLAVWVVQIKDDFIKSMAEQRIDDRAVLHLMALAMRRRAADVSDLCRRRVKTADSLSCTSAPLTSRRTRGGRYNWAGVSKSGSLGAPAIDGRVIESTTTETVVPHRVRDLEGK